MSFKDYFSAQSSQYIQFRPRYPRELFAYLSTLPPRRQRAWDCGAGSGQSSAALAEFFDEVMATDASKEQISHAPPHPGVRYLVAPAEDPPLESHSVDLVSVSQALHWFDFERFYAQVRRVGREGSILAAWAYGLVEISPEIDRAVQYLYEDVLGDFWPSERTLVDEHYTTLPFPFEELSAPAFVMTAQWKLSDLLGYLGTWSSVPKYRQRHGRDPLLEGAGDLVAAWGPPEEPRLMRWPLHLRVGRIG